MLTKLLNMLTMLLKQYFLLQSLEKVARSQNLGLQMCLEPKPKKGSFYDVQNFIAETLTHQILKKKNEHIWININEGLGWELL